MTGNETFAWTGFYEEFADKLLAYRNNRGALVAKVREVCNRLGHTYLDNAGAAAETGMADICPFTTLGTFNRGISDGNRKQIAAEIGSFLRVGNPVPDSFVGIPTLNNQSSVVYWDIKDVESLWEVFESALQLAKSDDAHVRKSFEDSYNRALEAKGVGINLTMGLYWIRPRRYPTLDSKSRKYMTDKLGIALSEIRLAGHQYLELSDDLIKRFAAPSFPVRSFQELSRVAYTPEGPPPPCPPVINDPPDPVFKPWSQEKIGKLAKELLWKPTHLQSVIAGLENKGQVIFQGPPGTGKTYVAKRIGEWAKEHGGDYKIVQFHP